MSKMFLKDGRVLELTEEQVYYLAKLIMYIPFHKQIKLNNEVFSLNDIDGEAWRNSKLPEQTGLNIEVVSVDKPVRKAME